MSSISSSNMHGEITFLIKPVHFVRYNFNPQSNTDDLSNVDTSEPRLSTAKTEQCSPINAATLTSEIFLSIGMGYLPRKNCLIFHC